MNNNRKGGHSHKSKSNRRKPAAVSAAIANLPVAKNDEIELEMIGLTHEGEGVGRADGYTLFVSGALPGERVKARVLKTKKQYGYAKLLKVLNESPDRVQAPCPIYTQCGGCQLQHMSYAGQLEWKRQHVIDNLERIGKLAVQKQAGSEDADSQVVEGTVTGNTPIRGTSAEGTTVKSSVDQDVHSSAVEAHVSAVQHPADASRSTSMKPIVSASHAIRVLPTLGMSEPWRYRNKAQVPIGQQDGQLVGGFYARGSHRIIDMQSCLIQDSRNDELVNKVKAIGQELHIQPYNEETGEGILRHVVVKVGFATNEMMIVLVTNGERLPRKPEWIERIRAEMPQVASICQNINTKQTNVIFGDETRTLWGRDVIHDYIGDVKFAISARSFYQVNPVQTEVLYEKAVQYAGLTGNETVIDAYCGIGTISLFLAQHAKRVYGVEIVKEAIEDARKNAELNGMTNVEFEVGASEDVIPRWKEQGITPDVIVVDPPRKGCDPRLLETIVQMQPEKVVYVSCNPSTLARDLQVLEEGGYRTVEVQPVDMFPHTVHVECVVKLEREDILLNEV
ncbi:23S rRNA (uracil(1939)-C(5))-methyltransferase RlmD [Paenibacillus hunanensis]|uniref:23S rRNA (uracil(1939)-C(5))-methyltransferase RlmD n=1 Tax=Paenibacillus hunanensis TaxID=539262 RepID=UPI0020265491|nr:23S rRNA (uracil(1939)-C(5))-methyltransferase RlmD [Paenibacillus hunanensis]MCL9661022.1 23S rRNA (uracil(1939)-C(5))-methyltransferase RlmD [Paenibacillus hunanensis]